MLLLVSDVLSLVEEMDLLCSEILWHQVGTAMYLELNCLIICPANQTHTLHTCVPAGFAYIQLPGMGYLQ